MPESTPHKVAQLVAKPTVAQFEIVGVAAVFVVVVDTAFDGKTDVFVELQCRDVRGSGVTGDRTVIVGDLGDESFTVAFTANFGSDREKEDVSVAPRRSESEQSVVFEQEMRGRAAVGVHKEAVPLFEHALALTDALFQLPRLFGVCVAARGIHPLFDVDAHYHGDNRGGDITPPSPFAPALERPVRRLNGNHLSSGVDSPRVSFELRDHTADVAVEATAADRSELFGAIADGLAAAMCESIPEGGERFSFTVRAESCEAVLFDYLDQLIYERDVRGVLPVDNHVEVSRAGEEWVVDASARGVPLQGLGAREVKAVTYSEMTVEETDDGWRGYVVFDV